MGHLSRSLENNSSGSNMDYGDPVQEASEGNNISNRTRNHFCDILAKNVATLCPCLKNLPEAELKSFGVISFTEEILRQLCAWL